MSETPCILPILLLSFYKGQIKTIDLQDNILNIHCSKKKLYLNKQIFALRRRRLYEPT